MLRNVLVLTVALSLLPSSNVSACNFDRPGKAAKLQLSFVRAYAECVDDDSSYGSTAACTPPEILPDDMMTTTPYEFGEVGSCALKVKTKLVKDCAVLTDAGGQSLNLEAGPCHVTFWKAKCSGITDGAGNPVGSSDAAFGLRSLSRWTLDDAGTKTVIDFPVTMSFSEPNNGKFSISFKYPEALVSLIGASDANLPPCTTFELLDVKIVDADGRPFATMGLSTGV